ncbi:Trigger factor [Aedoeadaptatus ivorii]|uniref:Trigger factor n=1 Tax=Aedoeadaptatus ivorii TaxID=54006 RepID=A0A3S5C2Q1_9FIRM|nr:trigger factor [Peptoniphilus ivorii]MDQ0508884.1 trigger factor [Peptoniphilus ivorii]VEJ35997.1 Trigger factor [Peptoniphilus ivorii]
MTEIKKQEKNKVYFDVVVPAAEIKEAETKIYKKNKNYFNVPGFRKGHVPKKIIEQFYGEGIFFEDALNEILPKYYEKAVEELDLKVIDQPNVEIDEETFDRNKDVTVQIDVDVRPEVTLGEYKGVEIEAVPTEVGEELIDNEIDKQRHLNARHINIDDRAAEEGDKVNIDFKGEVDGEAFEGGSAEDQELELGSGSFIPGFEEGIVGHEVGDEFDIDVTFPEDYFSEDLKGKEAVFHITLNSIGREELPELDDEFIKDISEFDTVEEYREDIRTKKTEEVVNNAKNLRANRVLEKVAENMQVELPPVMVDAAIEEQIRNMDYNMRSQGIQLEQYLGMLGQDLDEFKASMRPDAEKEVLKSLALEAVVAKEGFAVDDEEIEKEAREMAKNYFKGDEDKQEEMVKTMLETNTDALRGDLERRKAVDFLVEHAVEVEAEEKDEEETTEA